MYYDNLREESGIVILGLPNFQAKAPEETQQCYLDELKTYRHIQNPGVVVDFLEARQPMVGAAVTASQARQINEVIQKSLARGIFERYRERRKVGLARMAALTELDTSNQ